jgi:MPBQ/MSBQ methyltransferase
VRSNAVSRPRVDRALRFYEEVLGLGYLHYGLWDGDPPTHDGLQAAQTRYAERLADWVPPGVRRVLDVGCGTGGNAMLFASRGLVVDGLSPDPFQQERFTARTGRPFHLGRFEEVQLEAPYDLVLMSESCQYIRISRLFDAVRRATPGGWLLIADYFVYERSDRPLGRSGHQLDRFRQRAADAGFELVRDEDITEAVVPTLRVMRGWVDRYAMPTLNLVVGTLQERRPWLLHLLRWVLRRRFEHIRAQEELIDAAAFQAQKSYRMLLYRVPPAAPTAGPPRDPTTA